MNYISTRGQAPPVNFAQLLLSGAAPDGGLYMPERWPQLSERDIAALADKPFHEVSFFLLKLFAGGTIADDVLARACADAYATFDHKDVCPLSQLAPDMHLLELFHGPTFAFKDVAMQLLARLIEHELQRQNKKASIICATSGDTGAAAVEAFRHSKFATTVVLFPHGRISEVQRRQMTASGASNVIAIALIGSFDDAQTIVKDLFADQDFSASVSLASVNSINWARIAAQVTYYFTAALKLAGRNISFCVPTGNFGDSFAGYVAKKIGLPFSRLIVATNQNDILARALHTGVYEPGPVTPTTSPSMDIQVSSNFERLLFEASNRDAATVSTLMNDLRKKKHFVLPQPALESIRAGFSADAATETEVTQKIRGMHQQTGRFIDPHTAVALVVADKSKKTGETIIALATAHAAKFPDAVKAACNVAPPAPAKLAGLMDKNEIYVTLPPETAQVRDFLQKNL